MKGGTTQSIDPSVELLPDIPIPGAHEDLLDRQRVAVRLLELANAAPVTAPRVIALTGACGAGKSSVLQMVSELVVGRSEIAMVSLDAQTYASAQALMSKLAIKLNKLFSDLGVSKGTDKVRDAFISYGGVISSVIRVAGVKVDVADALERSSSSLRTEIARNLEQANKRLVIAMDHIDHLPPQELGGALAALRMYAAIP
jgi:Cdc6-like AAA superfamily ATPase